MEFFYDIRLNRLILTQDIEREGNGDMALTKTGMISNISELAGIDRKLSEQSFEKIIEIIKSALESGEDVLVSGFGKFSVDQKAMRKGRNPATGEDMMLPARKVVTFKSSGLLNERVNKKNK